MVAAALLPTMEVAAQNGKKVVLDSLIYISGPHTECVSDEDFRLVPYKGTELRAGLITDIFSLVSGPVEIDRPSDCSLKYELNTVYGTNVYTNEDDFSSFLTSWKILRVSRISNLFGCCCSGEECINTIGRFRELIVTRKWR